MRVAAIGVAAIRGHGRRYLSELIGVVIELDTELLAGREFDSSAAVISAYQVSGDPVQPAAR